MEDFEKITTALVVLMSLVVVFNSYQISQLRTENVQVESPAGAVTTSLDTPDVIPKGVPEIYGSELRVSFDDVSASNPVKADQTINKLALLDQQITLDSADKERYISIASRISCEYCCGAQALITSDGRPACGCAHSSAMRGLAKYLITKHGDNYTDDGILEELGKWKTLFYSAQITQKASILLDGGVELNYINLASNKYRGIEKGVSGSMVGGC